MPIEYRTSIYPDHAYETHTKWPYIHNNLYLDHMNRINKHPDHAYKSWPCLQTSCLHCNQITSIKKEKEKSFFIALLQSLSKAVKMSLTSNTVIIKWTKYFYESKVHEYIKCLKLLISLEWCLEYSWQKLYMFLYIMKQEHIKFYINIVVYRILIDLNWDWKNKSKLNLYFSQNVHFLHMNSRPTCLWLNVAGDMLLSKVNRKRQHSKYICKLYRT